MVAHSTNGKIVASLSRLAAGKSMSFSTFNGDIDVTLPADSKATLKARADNGDIFTDFDVKLEPQQPPSGCSTRSRPLRLLSRRRLFLARRQPPRRRRLRG